MGGGGGGWGWGMKAGANYLAMTNFEEAAWPRG